METQPSTSTISANPPTVYLVVQGGNGQSSSCGGSLSSPKAIKKMSFLQLLVFVVMIVSEFFVIFFDDSGGARSGIWGGAVFGMAGGLGLLAVRKDTTCTNVWYLVMVAIAFAFAIPVLVLNSVALGGNNDAVAVVFLSLMVFGAAVEMIVSMTCFVLCCQSLCCRRPTEQTGYLVKATSGNAPPGAIPVALDVELLRGILGQDQQGFLREQLPDGPPRYEEATKA